MNSRSENAPSAIASESISALVDNEADDLDLRRVLKEVADDEDVRATWRRYNLASSIMRKDSSAHMGLDISAAVRSEIELEPALSQNLSQNKSSSRWMDFVAKGSIAATVALGMLIGVQHFSSTVSPADPSVGQDTLVDAEAFVAPDLNSAKVPVGFDSPRLQARTVSTAQQTPGMAAPAGIQAVPQQRSAKGVAANPELQAQFSRLMMIHAQQVSGSSDLGVMSFARLTDLHALDNRPLSESANAEQGERLAPDANSSVEQAENH